MSLYVHEPILSVFEWNIRLARIGIQAKLSMWRIGHIWKILESNLRIEFQILFPKCRNQNRSTFLSPFTKWTEQSSTHTARTINPNTHKWVRLIDWLWHMHDVIFDKNTYNLKYFACESNRFTKIKYVFDVRFFCCLSHRWVDWGGIIRSIRRIWIVCYII